MLRNRPLDQAQGAEETYLDLLRDILTHGSEKDDRTGTGTVSAFGRQIRIDLTHGFPLLTTKKMYFPGIVHELLWFIRGDTNLQYLVRNNVRIWNEWPYRRYVREQERLGVTPLSMDAFIESIKSDDDFAQTWGDLGPIYGAQWRRWKGPNGTEIDQLAGVIAEIKKNPTSRRLIVSGWNAADIEEMAVAGLPPCHTLYQFYVIGGRLSCQLYQRSADLFLGVPFNIASYALLTLLVAHVTGYAPGEFIHTFGDIHIYKNHIKQVQEQLSRAPRHLPTLHMNPHITDLFSVRFEDISLEGYDPHPAIRAVVAV